MLRALTFIWRKIAWFYWYSPISMGVKHNPKEVYWLYISNFVGFFALFIFVSNYIILGDNFNQTDKRVWLSVIILVSILICLSTTLSMLYGFFNREKIVPSDVKPISFRYILYLSFPIIYFIVFRRPRK